MKDDNCIFCKIANGEIPSYTLYEDDSFRVILDLAPASLGHALILPKNHAKDLYELDDEMASKALFVAKKVAKVMVQELQCDGLNVLQNNGVAAGQTVFHFHIHLIPRYEGKNKILTWAQGNPEEGELERISKKIREAF